MSSVTTPTRPYARVSDIPSWLAKLSVQELSELVENRLLGFPAGLPLPNRDEEPKDILEYAFRKANDDLREKFRKALRGVVDRLTADVLSRGATLLEDRYDLLDGVCSLVAYTSSTEAWDSLSLLYNRLGDDNAKAVRTVILRCLSGLVRPPESQGMDIFGPMVEKFESLLADFELCGLAFQALFRYDTRRAARAVPRLAATLLSQAPRDATHSLARILSPMVALLSATDQEGFVASTRDAAWKASGKGSDGLLIGCVYKGLREMWGLVPEVRNHIETAWSLLKKLESNMIADVVANHAGRPLSNMIADVVDSLAGCPLSASAATKQAGRRGDVPLKASVNYLSPSLHSSCAASGASLSKRQGAVKLNRLEDLAKKYGFSDSETDDDWLEGIPGASTRYKARLHEIPKSPAPVHFYTPSKRSNKKYDAAPYQTCEAPASASIIPISREQEQDLMYPSSTACVRSAQELADTLR